MLMKIAELTGAALDWAVAKCEGWLEEADDPNDGAEFLDTVHSYGHCHYSTEWIKAGPIIEREKICVNKNLGDSWRGSIRHTKPHPLVSHPVLAGWTHQHGETPLIASMRCYVASKLGDYVDVPEELAC